MRYPERLVSVSSGEERQDTDIHRKEDYLKTSARSTVGCRGRSPANDIPFHQSAVGGRAENGRLLIRTTCVSLSA